MIMSIAALGFVTIPDDPSRMSVMVNVKLPTVFSGADALSTALGVVLVLMVAPATIYRFAATLPDTAPAVDDELIVMAFNNENGYDTDGNFNGHCFAKAVAGNTIALDVRLVEQCFVKTLVITVNAAISVCGNGQQYGWHCSSST